MQGLFPFSSSTNNIANQSCFDSSEESSEKNHIILMIIDALYSDYVFNKNTSYYLKSIEKLEEKGKALSINLRTHTPTVTLLLACLQRRESVYIRKKKEGGTPPNRTKTHPYI